MKKLVLENSIKDGLVLYPNEDGQGIIISQDEMLELSNHYYKIYDVIVSRLSARINDLLNVDGISTEIVIRNASIPIIYAYLDRLIRLNKLVISNGLDFNVPKIVDCITPLSVNVFRENIDQSPGFNEYIVAWVSRLWNIKQRDEYVIIKPFVVKAKYNNLSRIYRKTIFNGFFYRLQILFSRAKKGNILVFGEANAEIPFMKYGFYRKFLRKLELDWKIKHTNSNHDLRDKVFTSDLFKCDELNNLFKENMVGLNNNNIFNDLCLFFKKFYPIDSLELFLHNSQQAKDILQTNTSKFIIARGGGTRGRFVVAVAKSKGIKIIGMQHGGYYGYMHDMHYAIAQEYRDIDILISWGWSRLPENLVKDIEVVALPSPWLSERKSFWSCVKKNNKKKYDILFMPNAVLRFPGTLGGATGARSDVTKDTSICIKNTVETLASNGISIVHKPYCNKTLLLLKKTIQYLESRYANNYYCLKEVDKGFNEDLISKSSLVLYTQPGTGFLECITAGIPVMIYWTGFSSKEEMWAIDAFNKLEFVGLVHRDINSLYKEVSLFKSSPYEWMNNTERRIAISDFIEAYCNIDQNWHVKWRDYFYTLEQ
jgi:putative transferase (TIGR04331 family)